MRRRILMCIGILEMLAAGVFVVFSFAIPQRQAVSQTFERMEKVGRSAEKQVQLMREQVAEVRHKDFPKAFGELRAQTHAVSKNLNQSIDFRAIEAASNALADLFKKMDGWSGTLDPGKYLVDEGSATVNESFDDHMSHSILAAVGSWEKCANDLELDVCAVLSLASLPSNDKNSRALDASAANCVTDLTNLEKSLAAGSSESNRSGLVGSERSLDKLVGQAETISEAVYPTLSANGTSEMRSVWPDGKRAVAALREARDRVQKCNRELDDVARGLVPVRTRFEKGNRGASFAPACDDAMWIVERLRKVCAAIADAVKSMGRIRGYAREIRKTQEGIEQAMRNWPELVETMHRSASIFASSRKRLEMLLAQREHYEQALKSSLQLVRTTEDLLRTGTTKLDVRLGEQEYSLGQVEHGINEANESLPAVARSAGDLVQAIRWAMWIVAALVGLHGLFVVVGAGPRRSSRG